MGVTFLIVDCDESKPSSHSDNAAIENVALVIGKQGRHEEADEQLTAALERERRLQGNEHSDTLAYERSLARLRVAEDRFDEALVILERNVAMVRAGSENPLELADALMLYGEALQGAGRRAESEPVLTEALALFEAALPDDHRDVASTCELIDSPVPG